MTTETKQSTIRAELERMYEAARCMADPEHCLHATRDELPWAALAEQAKEALDADAEDNAPALALLIALRAVLSALTQTATYPADIAAARVFARAAIAKATSGEA